MRFLLLNQFYPPDPAPTGQYLHDVARTLVERGHQVDVVCSRRSYDGTRSFSKSETLAGVRVRRLPASGFCRRSYVGKLADYGTFYASLLAALLFRRERPDMILSLTTPPYIGLLGRLAAARHRCQRADWVMDLYPDVMYAQGMARNHPFLFGCLQRLTRLQLRRTGCVVVLGPFMAEKVSAYLKPNRHHGEPPTSDFMELKRGDGVAPIAWIPLWTDPQLEPWPDYEPNWLRVRRGWRADETVCLYSGNMGLGHRFGEFLEAARRLGSAGPRWVFTGGGKRKCEIESFARNHPEARLEVSGYVPKEELRAHLCAADVHLASLDSSWEGLIVPSKLQGCFAVGRPVLFVGGRNNETATWIDQSGGVDSGIRLDFDFAGKSR